VPSVVDTKNGTNPCSSSSSMASPIVWPRRLAFSSGSRIRNLTIWPLVIFVAIVVAVAAAAIVVAVAAVDLEFVARLSRSLGMVRSLLQNCDVKLMYAHWYQDDGNCEEKDLEK